MPQTWDVEVPSLVIFGTEHSMVTFSNYHMLSRQFQTCYAMIELSPHWSPGSFFPCFFVVAVRPLSPGPPCPS